MAQPSSRQELIDYCLRQLGAPVLEVNVADEQIQDLVDDAVQYFQERHFDGVSQVYLKYKITQNDIDRGKARPTTGVGIATTSATANIVGTVTTFTYNENIKYQMFLNDIYYWGTTDLLSYSMAMTYLETINFLVNTHKQIRFNQRKNRMYLDVDWSNLRVGEYLIIDCWKAMDPDTYSRVWNDSFLKPYLTALIKRQWGQNLIKFQGVKLPGGIEFNGRQLYDDAQLELDKIKEKMSNTYELPPLDMIG